MYKHDNQHVLLELNSVGDKPDMVFPPISRPPRKKADLTPSHTRVVAGRGPTHPDKFLSEAARWSGRCITGRNIIISLGDPPSCISLFFLSLFHHIISQPLRPKKSSKKDTERELFRHNCSLRPFRPHIPIILGSAFWPGELANDFAQLTLRLL